jgi:S1-C subfamily serine protease
MVRSFLPAALIILSAVDAGAVDSKETDRVRRSLVRILATAQNADYRTPWNAGGPRQSVGSGFVIDGQRILTNAHVVSNARLLNVERYGSARPSVARVEFMAHDCDLAILKVDDPTFFEGMTTLQPGDLPALHSNVTAYGYPIGGQRMSVTRGVVSRIEFRTYSHSGLDAHLTVQIDAAINPGNSGGPVVQDGKFVGVAFQGFSGAVAQNTGYMIPTPVVRRLFRDVEDGRYDGYVELAVEYSNLLNPAHRRAVGLPPGDNGVIVTDLLSVGSAAGALEVDDVLLAIDGHAIRADGQIQLDGEFVQLEEIVERKFHGDKVRFDFLRAGKARSVDVTLKGAWPFRLLASQYDVQPRFVVFAGLVFQPITRNFMVEHKVKDPDVTFYYHHFVAEKLYQDRNELVILSSIVNDPINSYLRGFRHSVVDTVNGEHIADVRALAAALDKDVEHHVITFLGSGQPLVVESRQLPDARKRILSQYNVTSERYLGPPQEAAE